MIHEIRDNLRTYVQDPVAEAQIRVMHPTRIRVVAELPKQNEQLLFSTPQDFRRVLSWFGKMLDDIRKRRVFLNLVDRSEENGFQNIAVSTYWK